MDDNKKNIKKYLVISLLILGIFVLISVIIFLFVILGFVSNFYTLTDNTLVNITTSFNKIVIDGNHITQNINIIKNLFKYLDTKNSTDIIIKYMIQIANDLNHITRKIG